MFTQLVCALLLQFDVQKTTSFPEAALDMAFVTTMESWVVELEPPPYRKATALRLMSKAVKGPMLRMGARYYKVRDKAKAELLALGSDIIPQLQLGTYLGDPEITLRCRNLLRALSQCPDCHGSGYINSGGYATGCARCRRVGRLWPLEDQLRDEGWW